MKIKELLKEILKQDVTTEDWEYLYHTVIDKHWETKPAVDDDYFQSAKLLNKLANSDVPELIMLTAKIAEQAFQVIEQKTEVVQAEIHVGDHKLFFRLASSKDAIDNLQKMLTNTVIVKAQEQPTTSGERAE